MRTSCWLTPWIGAVGKFETDLNYNLRLPPTWEKTLPGNVPAWNIIPRSMVAFLLLYFCCIFVVFPLYFCCISVVFLLYFCCICAVFVLYLCCISSVVRPVDEDAGNPFPVSSLNYSEAKLMSPKDYQSPRQTFYKGSTLLQITSNTNTNIKDYQ